MLVIGQHHGVKNGQHAVRRVGGYHVHLVVAKRRIQQPQIHGDRPSCNPEAICFREPFPSVSAFHEFVSRADPPRTGCGRRQGGKPATLTVGSSYHHCEGVVEAKRRKPDKMKLLSVRVLYLPENGLGIVKRWAV